MTAPWREGRRPGALRSRRARERRAVVRDAPTPSSLPPPSAPAPAAPLPQVHLSEEVGDLLQWMLSPDPRDRPNLASVMTHAWVVNGEVHPPHLPHG